jgi:lysophospholipase L1-like esterase
MQRVPAVSRLALRHKLSGVAGRRSPVEIVATMGTYLTRTQAAELSGLRAGPFGRWADGVTAMREDCLAFARYWQAHNDRIAAQDGPLWVVLGDSTAQGLGALSPDGGYVGQVLAELRQQTGLPWRVLNLAASGAITRDVIDRQLPRLPAGPLSPALVSCGVGVNDILYTGPGRLFADLRALVAALPDQTVLLDLPLPAGCWGLLGRASVPYVTRINRTIHQAAAARGLPVAEVSAHFMPPWAGKFASDCFHPSQEGYRDWARALLAALPAELHFARSLSSRTARGACARNLSRAARADRPAPSACSDPAARAVGARRGSRGILRRIRPRRSRSAVRGHRP